MSPDRDLADLDCSPCASGEAPLAGDALTALHARLGNGWEVVDGHHLVKKYSFPDFVEALAFTNRVGELAERHNHHPDIELSWGRVQLLIFTHDIGGLGERDFVWAAKADRLEQAS